MERCSALYPEQRSGLPAKVKIVKVKQPDRMLIAELIARWKLLVEVHIAAMQLCVFVHLIDQSHKKTVLVERNEGKEKSEQ